MSAATGDLLAELARAGVHDVTDRTVDRAAYAGDASLYRVVPQVVARPRHPDELVALVDVARRTGVPLTARGAGTSIAGNAVGPGIVVDCARHLDRVLDLDAESGLAVVQPGTVHATLQRAALAAGWRFGPDPSTHSRCTVGGMLGNNACGSRALGYGRTSDNTEALEVVWGTGATERLAPGSTGPGATALAAAVASDLALVRTTFGRFSRQVSGYACEHLLPERLRPERFLVGSEGTLALVREATVRLVRDPAARALVVLGYPVVAEAADAVPALLGAEGMVACEGLDVRLVALVPGAPPLPRGTGWLMVEVVGEDPGQVASRAATVVAAAGALDHRVVTDAREQAALWRIREDGAGLAARSLSRPAHAGWEDAAVPPEQLGTWLRRFDELLAAHRLDGVPYGHFGDGCLHVRIDFTFDDGGAAFRAFLTDAAAELAALGGSLSGEHGDGRARSELLGTMYPPEALRLFAGLKAVADPEGVLNPGVLVDPAPLDADLRPARRAAQPPGLRLVPELAADVHRCTGVGRCVSGPSWSVMCPSWQATREEKDSTRGRARVLQEALDGTLVAGLDDPAVHDALDLCLACKGCATDCPTGVDMAAMKAEVLHQRHAGRPWSRPLSHWALGGLPRLLGSPLRGLLRLAARPAVSRLVAPLAGIDRRRSLPLPAARSLRRRSGTSPEVTSEVWIWADTFTDHLAPGVAEAAIALLARAGVTARVLDVDACCGLTLVSTGQLDAAARRADRTVATLAPLLEGGARLLGLEPSCLATLRSDVVELSSDPRAAEVAGAAVSLAELLTELVEQGRWTPPDLRRTTVVVQPHCHQQAVVGWQADADLLERTGAEVVRLGGCCGLAGNFGLEAGHHDVSVAVAGTQLLPALEDHPDAVFLADGLSCRTQAADLAGRPGVHLAQLLTT